MRLVAWGLLAIALAAGTWSDTPAKDDPIWLGGYRVLQADLHVHNLPLSGSTLSPLELIFEARRQGLDAIAMTPHNTVLAGKVGHWLSQHLGGPIVIPGEEIHGPRFHMIAAGTYRTISWRLSARDTIDEIHRQGGVAIAAHPVIDTWPSYDAEALRKLDGAEVAQPAMYSSTYATDQLREFYGKAPMAAIGSSDYHGLGPLGLCRTLVFVREATEQGILDAIRARRTVVLDRCLAFGDVGLIPLVKADPRFRGGDPPATNGVLPLISRVCAVLGLIALCGAVRLTELT